jgi:hypothetical protein
VACHDHELHRAGRGEGRSADTLLLEHADLAEEVVRPKRVLDFTRVVDFRGNVDIFRVLSDLVALACIEARKKRQLLEVLDVHRPSRT